MKSKVEVVGVESGYCEVGLLSLGRFRNGFTLRCEPKAQLLVLGRDTRTYVKRCVFVFPSRHLRLFFSFVCLWLLNFRRPSASQNAPQATFKKLFVSPTKSYSEE